MYFIKLAAYVYPVSLVCIPTKDMKIIKGRKYGIFHIHPKVVYTLFLLVAVLQRGNAVYDALRHGTKSVPI